MTSKGREMNLNGREMTFKGWEISFKGRGTGSIGKEIMLNWKEI